MAQKKNNNVKFYELESFLSSVNQNDIPPLVLIYGEPYLIRESFKIISAFLLGSEQNRFAIETLEGGSVSMGDIIEQVSTFSFLVSKKIVAVKNIPLFQAQQGGPEIGFSPADLDRFMDFIEKGIPENHFLILTTPHIDKRKKIYKTIADMGLVIDGSVATGARKADVDEQRSVLQTVAGKILTRYKKTMDNQAFNSLVELTGFNMELFAQNLEKLVVYSGNNRTVSITDVKAVIIRDKKDPIFNLTNAFMEKNVTKTLFYLNSLFNEGFHPLQILKSFENLIRKLILVKSFTRQFSQNHTINFKNINFNSFKQTVMPKVIQHDERTKSDITARNEYLSKQDPNDKKPLKKKKETSNDLFLAPNSKNPYPVFQVFQKSENFSFIELNHALFFLSDLDYQLKSSSVDAVTKIECFIIKSCSKGGFEYAQENKNRRHHI
ncbi:DNA polymerase III subunit delta [Desulfobacula phenolica]|uniref:DNA polymerase III subunit delta n=1 Tax=Desulfobacula phenolica TaxID=90732 RepID=A0A1H2JUK1_9BACT|nr:DNA polymerase III subunit delta [Desulfobacula phenolica]SDU60159.1 DNA polymerase III, delta subunit [Desulfobacula phenolica]